MHSALRTAMGGVRAGATRSGGSRIALASALPPIGISLDPAARRCELGSGALSLARPHRSDRVLRQSAELYRPVAADRHQEHVSRLARRLGAGAGSAVSPRD